MAEFISAYRGLRPRIGHNYAKLHAMQAYIKLGNIQPKVAAAHWFQDPNLS